MKIKILSGLLAFALAVITVPLHADATADAKTFLDAQRALNAAPSGTNIQAIANANVAQITAAVPVVSALNSAEVYTLTVLLGSMTSPPTDPIAFAQANCPVIWIGRYASSTDVDAWVAANPNTYLPSVVSVLWYKYPSSAHTTALNTYAANFIGKPTDFTLWPHWFLLHLRGLSKADALTALNSEAAYLATLPNSSLPSTPEGKFTGQVATALVLYNNLP